MTATKWFANLALAFLLLWHDSWLPPLVKSLSFLFSQELPSKEYLYLFLRGFPIHPQELLVLTFLLIISYLAIRYRIRLTPVVFVLLLIVPFRENGQPKGEIDRSLEAFFQSEAKRVIHLDAPKKHVPEFDLIILHVCSLSWDDLKEAGLDEDPFFNQFNYLFTRFNSVTSYSNPSALRLLKASCGQTKHEALYRESGEACYLFDSLRKLGFDTYFTLNHDGIYSHFAEEVKKLGHLDEPLKPEGLTAQRFNFDESPIYDDYTVLEKWWHLRQASPSRNAALYYNTISLHDGAHLAGEKEWWKKDPKVQYQVFIRKLFSDTTRFINLLESSNRRIVIFFVPEHGLALRGTSIQARGLREIPLPQITTIPVGIRLIGKGAPLLPETPRVISKPVSYLSLSYILSSFLEQSPFESKRYETSEWLNQLPETDFIAENETIRIVKQGEDYYFYGKENQWLKLAPETVNKKKD